MKFKGRLCHGSGDGYLYTIPNNSRNFDSERKNMEGRNPEGKTPTNPEDTAANTTNTEIKLLTTGDREVDKK